MTSFAKQEFRIDLEELAEQFDEHGYALTKPLLSEKDCGSLIRMYGDKVKFRSRVVMERHNFGRGEYQYFAEPLPELVQRLRESFYAPLAELANGWAQRLNQVERFPTSLNEFLEFCRSREQTLPTPLMLRYRKDDYNCLHQDLYGEISFPLQAACVLSQHGCDYEGGEFLLTEQRPRMQTRGEAVTIERGAFIVFPNRWRPVVGKRGDYRVNVRHGVSRLKSGERYCLGIIFHNAK
jgi:hypothetical protein